MTVSTLINAQHISATTRGVPLLVQADHLFLLKYLTMPFEKFYDAGPILAFTRKHYWLGPITALTYLGAIRGLRGVMGNRKAFNLRTPLKYWNLFLAIFSLLGALRTVPQLLLVLSNFGLTSVLCAPSLFTYGSGSSGLWTMLFVYSKFAELADTAFILLRKRQLSFLHWYHHATVLLYCWDAYTREQPAGIFFVAMNFVVHAVMYFYYYLAAAMTRPPSWGKSVTVLQIAQMFGGIFITGFSIYLAFKYQITATYFDDEGLLQADYPSDPLEVISPCVSGKCFLSVNNIVMATTMYGSYLYLFGRFFVKRYMSSQQSKKTV